MFQTHYSSCFYLEKHVYYDICLLINALDHILREYQLNNSKSKFRNGKKVL